jgi:hypothetical protein
MKDDNSLQKPLLGVGFSDLKVGEKESTTVGLYSNFLLFSIFFSINHGCAASCIAYSTAELGNNSGSIGSGLLYAFYSISALLFSVPLVELVSLPECCSLYLFRIESYYSLRIDTKCNIYIYVNKCTHISV